MNDSFRFSLIPILLAQMPGSGSDPWWVPLANFGISGIMLGWFMWRDKRESEKQDKRHEENLAAQRAIEDAFRTNTTSIITSMAGVKHLDGVIADLLARIEQQNKKKG